jgi:hypothetical protein
MSPHPTVGVLAPSWRYLPFHCLEIVAPSIRDFLHLTVLSHPAMLLAEQYVLKTIDWNLCYANPIHFFRLSKADDDDISSTIGAYLLEASTLEWRSPRSS